MDILLRDVAKLHDEMKQELSERRAMLERCEDRGDCFWLRGRIEILKEDIGRTERLIRGKASKLDIVWAKEKIKKDKAS